MNGLRNLAGRSESDLSVYIGNVSSGDLGIVMFGRRFMYYLSDYIMFDVLQPLMKEKYD